MEEWEEIKDYLVGRQAEIRDRLQRIENDRRHLNKPLEKDFDEQAIEMENDEVLDALVDSIWIEIEQIQKSLTKLSAGTYGVCEVCGRTIGKKRIKALPHASRCIGCQEKAGMGGQV